MSKPQNNNGESKVLRSHYLDLVLNQILNFDPYLIPGQKIASVNSKLPTLVS